ncbi:MAG: Sulfate transporter/antisigma-factor antagonist [Gammaproteobacteria bacterium]|jgi:phospholipid transport system transporter-binding protein|nr:Sulfate transporter/antisigma-factor antagonist [Gammaproteobacteria bacterium]
METTATIVCEDHRLRVSGELNFKTVEALWKQSLPFLSSQQSSIDIDLSQITMSNSAGLALLVEWLKYAKRENKTIIFHGIPPQLQSIAKVAAVNLI